MRIANLSYPNFDFGYETTVKLPFHFSRCSNGALTSVDEGAAYDMYRVKGTMTVPPEKLGELGTFGDAGSQGWKYFIWQLRDSGFYPFTPALAGVKQNLIPANVIDDAFFVAFSKIDVKRKADLFARAFSVDMEMLMVIENYEEPLFTDRRSGVPTEGAMEIQLPAQQGATFTGGIRHPVNGFDVSVRYSAYPQQMLGGGVSSVNYAFLRESRPGGIRESSMIITANTGAAINILNALLKYIRAKPFRLRAPRNYAVFGSRDHEVFSVKLASDELRVKHVRFDEFEIALNLIMEDALV